MTEMNLLTDKTAVITGGSSGIGRSIAIQYAKNGADTVIADRRKIPREGGKPTHEKINQKTQSKSSYINCDISNIEDIENAIEEANNFGGLDILVNNAAIVQMDDFDIEEQRFDKIYDTNIRGYFFASKIASDNMQEGSIINISSVEALEGTGLRPVYGSTKGAIRQMTFALADRLGPKIRVNVIHPGLIETEMVKKDVPIFGNEDLLNEIKNMIPLDRTGDKEEIAGPAVFLASDLASYITGAEILVDGGLTYTF